MKRKGFTLIETVVVVGIFGLLMLAGTDFFVQIIQNTSRTTIENEVHQSANAVMQSLSTSIRKATCVSYVVGNTAGWQPPGHGDVMLQTYSDDACTALVDTYQFVFDPDVHGELNSGKVLKNGVLVSPPDVAFVNCTGGSQCQTDWGQCQNGFSLPGVISPAWSGMTTGAISISLVVQATTSATQADFCAVTKLSDTITPRTQF